MANDYFCKDCSNNNNGWCNIKKCQGLKAITECEHKNKASTDLISKIVNLQEEKESKEFVMNKVKEFDQPDFLRVMQARALIETRYEWRRWVDEIPSLNFNPDWLVKIIPPTGGAIVRFIVSTREKPNSFISVYLDCYAELGVMSQPYWEIYPDVDGNNSRFYMNQTEELMEAILLSLNSL